VIQTFSGVEMVKVPAGCFMMGHNAGRRDERPAHQICFNVPYWIDRTEVTNKQYGQPGVFKGDNRPRDNLLWSEARDFCQRRGGRLPTEAEWEYAARGPDNWIYPWGADLIEDNLVFDRNSNGQPADVGSRPAGASWVGALDMSGNVFEWVSSLYKPYPYKADDGREDLTDTTGLRVFRGGINSYIDYAAGGAIRFWARPDQRDWFIGFRCARAA
jgi:iron(II)-dependent oxidoreductase